MCGRYVLEGPAGRLADYFQARYTEDVSLFANRYNIAPTSVVPVVRINREGERVILNHQWGLVPHWAKDATGSAKLNNARGETVDQKPSFRVAFRRFRCLIPASGYYEWQAPDEGSGAKKQPYYLYPSAPENTPYLAMAGVCDHWRSPDGQLLLSTAIVTTAAHPNLQAIHDRMPVMLPPEHWATWLDPQMQAVLTLRALIRPSSDVQAHPVGHGVSQVGRSRLDDPRLIDRLGS